MKKKPGRLSGERNWTLGDEKKYLDYVGTGTWTTATTLSRVLLLRQYIDNMPQLRNEPWLKDAVKYAKELLKEELRCLD